jgi:hypothetical protein
MPDLNGSAPDSDDDIGALKRQLAEAKQMLADTEHARKAEHDGRVRGEQRIQAESGARFMAQKSAVESSIHAHETAIAGYEQDLARAMQVQDSNAMSKITRDIARLETRLEGLRNSKEQIDQIERSGGPRPQPVPGEDPRLATMSETSKDWVRRHPQFLTDENFFNKTVGYHNLAKAEGHAVDSPGYFAFIERKLGLREADEDDDQRPRPSREHQADISGDIAPPDDNRGFDRGAIQRERDRRPERDATSSAARPSRGAANSGESYAESGHSGGSDPHLTPAELEIAQLSYPDEWAKDPRIAKKLYGDHKKYLKSIGKIGTGH